MKTLNGDIGRVRYRYGRLFPNRQPKTLLATQRIGDFVFFGISRCNKCDTFKKVEARAIAEARLGQASARFELLDYIEVQGDPLEVPSFYVLEDGLCGFAHLSSVEFIHLYFDNIDKDINASREAFLEERFGLCNC